MIKSLFYRNTTIILSCILLSLSMTACCKKCDDIFRATSHLKCTINNIDYIDHNPLIIPTAARTPHASYYIYPDSSYYMTFLSQCYSDNESKGALRSIYCIEYKVNEIIPLCIGKRYLVKSIPNLDYLMSWDTTNQYDEKKYSYCTIRSEDHALCFGTGHVEFTEIDFEKQWVKGEIDFEIIAPGKDDNDKTKLKIKGEFQCTMRTFKHAGRFS